jgi:hypothetical protein
MTRLGGLASLPTPCAQALLARMANSVIAETSGDQATAHIPIDTMLLAYVHNRGRLRSRHEVGPSEGCTGRFVLLGDGLKMFKRMHLSEIIAAGELGHAFEVRR